MSFFDDIAALVQVQPTAPTSDNAIALNRAGYQLDSAGQSIGAASHLQFGLQSLQAARFQADQLRQNAGQAQASGQRAALDEDRKTQLVTSAALASAAASGGGASDPTVVNLIAKTAGEGAYRRAVALYQGDERARAMNLSADAKEYEGKTTAINSAIVAGSQVVGAGTTLLKGAAREGSLYQRFGGGGPRASAAVSDLWANNGPGE